MVNEFFLKNLEEEGMRLGISPEKRRALIREYLQTRIIAGVYSQGGSELLSFIGGTSLRLLRGLDRFSEDLDFDNLGLPLGRITSLVRHAVYALEREGFTATLMLKQKEGSGMGDIKFERLLFDLKISAHQEEKLLIKINYTTPIERPRNEVVVMARFGFVQSVVTNTMGVLLAQKLRAIFSRKDLQPRDFYDTVWFLSRNIAPDPDILRAIGIEKAAHAFEKAYAIFREKVVPNMRAFKNRLRPFLQNEDNISFLDAFGELVSRRGKT